eukprot:GFUD01007063.1.p2 GENE.GFUD01007063.1~~GFUD01007063.1.p2  ORF type:complete len:113 (+),score=10.39 GFUD01007063.1:116-454(+)
MFMLAIRLLHLLAIRSRFYLMFSLDWSQEKRNRGNLRNAVPQDGPSLDLTAIGIFQLHSILRMQQMSAKSTWGGSLRCNQPQKTDLLIPLYQLAQGHGLDYLERRSIHTGPG